MAANKKQFYFTDGGNMHVTNNEVVPYITTNVPTKYWTPH